MQASASWEGSENLGFFLDFIWNTVNTGGIENLAAAMPNWFKAHFIDYDKVTYLSITIVTWGFEIRNKRNSGTIVTV